MNLLKILIEDGNGPVHSIARRTPPSARKQLDRIAHDLNILFAAQCLRFVARVVKEAV